MKIFSEYFESCPLIAILRGIKPNEILTIGEALIEAGFRIIEIPLNSPEALKSIELAAKHFTNDILIGAGTVLNTDQVQKVSNAGGRLIVSPHADPLIVTKTKALNLFAIPGFCSVTEAQSMIRCNADALKLFPAEGNPPETLKAIRAVLDQSIHILPVGGITPEKIAPYLKAGANGFGLGSALYRPGDKPNEVSLKARDFLNAMKEHQHYKR
jgi:2-dehydro-3-deoxyphosphogalactonate aldolase